MAEKSAARHLAETILPAASLGLTSGTNCFYDKLPKDKKPNTLIVGVYNTGGFDPVRNPDNTQYQVTVSVIVVGKPSGYTAAETLIEDIRKYLIETMGSKIVSGTTYYGTYQQGDTAFIKYDENNRPIFTANFRMYRTF